MDIITRKSGHNLGKVRIVGNDVNEIIHISEALTRAEDLGLDLVLVSDQATPPVVRIQDFKKLEYEKKKAKKSNKPSTSVLKEIQFKINISDHDIQTKVDKIDKFLVKGEKVKISVRLKGREKDTPHRAEELISKVCEIVKNAKANKIPGPMPMAILEPIKAVPKKSMVAGE